MKRLILFAIVALLLLNGYPQRIFTPQTYWQGRVKYLQKQLVEEQAKLAMLNEQLVQLSSGQVRGAATGLLLPPEAVDEMRTKNMLKQKQVLRKLQTQMGALRDAQRSYSESLNG